MKNSVFLVVLSLCIIPFFSYSADEKVITLMTTESFVSDFMRSLKKRDIESFSRNRQSLDQYGKKERKKIEKAITKAFKSTYSNEDNILHLIVRLEQSDTLKQQGDYRYLLSAIEFIYYRLGKRQIDFWLKKTIKGFLPHRKLLFQKV